jgi:hypothetical protein
MSRRETISWVACAAVALLAAGDVGFGIAHTGYGVRAVAVDNALPIPPLPVPVPPILTAPAPAPAPACTTAHGPFVPDGVALPGIADHVPVLPLRRDLNGTPGVPPLSSIGKTEMAFDLGSGIRPGGGHGNALLNAHTWPDGSALGNQLLAHLHKGDRIVVHGSSGQLCYQVTDRVEVPATDPGKRYYATTGRPQIALVVCSGRRLGPGHWTMRTIWYASPIK